MTAALDTSAVAIKGGGNNVLFPTPTQRDTTLTRLEEMNRLMVSALLVSHVKMDTLEP
jgi:hypothetical protein